MKYVPFFSITLLLNAWLVLSPNFSNQDAWPVPENYDAMENPIALDDKEAMAVGKDLYNKHCRSCHGKKGQGDGPMAAQLVSDPKDFSDPVFKEQSDGAIFYKAWTGRNEMPGFEKRISDEEDMWCVVNYLRTLE